MLQKVRGFPESGSRNGNTPSSSGSFFPEVTTSLLSPIHCPSRSSQGTHLGKCFHPQASGATRRPSWHLCGVVTSASRQRSCLQHSTLEVSPKGSQMWQARKFTEKVSAPRTPWQRSWCSRQQKRQSRCSFSGLRSLFLEGTACKKGKPIACSCLRIENLFLHSTN